ncbi:ABC transporter ATP-binding protein [Cognataquiflexum aquatile]|uniref:ABC transporter ATP-binding protein n=1 Tax=Cognataquiflexum aquatile TaxID=2249427 RepID=UPI000DE9BCA0|nr:ABC transporter ATP-binding protein [Cognataquiflexum aquatile]
MSKVVIRVDNVGKKYRLGVIGTGRLKDDLNMWWAKARGKENPYSKVDSENPGSFDEKEFWALRDLSFEVKEGEVLGIIGKNGAGKSTLLKLLSRVTTPTTGEIKIKGRIASLLEVGTGFHPELTGRENIFLNGAILGMTKAEIRSKLDEIIAFSGVEVYVDTPVKRYSSGMYVRLAFAVAAHLEPEILIVDEVLAVGDADFQKKCIGKMGQVAKEGRTILFVSHNMGAVQALCSRAIMLQSGKLFYEGTTRDTIAKYSHMAFDGTKAMKIWPDPSIAPGNFSVKLLSVKVLDNLENVRNIFTDNEEFFIEMEFSVQNAGNSLTSNLQLFTEGGIFVLSSGNWASTTLNVDPYSNRTFGKGIFKSRMKFPAYFFNEGGYFINAIINREAMTPIVYVEEAVTFTIVDSGDMRKEYTDFMGGVVRPKLEWMTTQVNEYSLNTN